MIFFIQYIFPITILLIVSIITSLYIRFGILPKNQEAMDLFNQLNLNIEGFCIILVIYQVLFSIINLSLTAISRFGKNAIFIKYIPIELYNQFWLKNALQIGVSIIISFMVCLVIKILCSSISIGYVIAIFINGILIGILNSVIMLIVDLKRPVLNWKNEYEVLKQNNNKLFQYIYTIFMVLTLMYFMNIFNDINFNTAILIISCIFVISIIFIDKYVKVQTKKNKLFDKIN